MEEIIVRYIHFLGIIGLSAALIGEHLLVAPKVSARQMRKLAVVDGIYGFSAVLTLVAGLLLWFWVGKSAEFYSKNWIFHLKVTVFVVIALMSIYPTVFFIRNRKTKKEFVDIPRKLIMILRFEILLLLILPLLAVLMSRGVGLYN